ncbi:peptidase S74, partial [Bacillus cytotoxicus]
MYNRILSTLGSKANKELLEQLEKLVQETDEKVEIVQKESEAAKQLAEKVQENLKNYQTTIIESVNPPTTGLEDGKTLWLDISNGKPGILKLWKNGDWEPVVPDVESVKQETLEQVNKDIESAKTELNQKVQEAQEQATGQFNEVQESLQGVSRTISDVQNEQGNINKKVTQIEQTSEGFKTSIEELTKQGNEIGDKVNTIEHTVEGTQQTIADIKSTTDGLTKTTTEIKEQAGKITEKMSSLEKREVNVRNYVINSDFSNSNNNWVGITNPVTTKIIDVNIPEVPTIKKGLQVTSNKAFIHQNLRADLFKKKRGVVSCYVDVKTVTSTNEFPRLYMRFTYDQNGTNKNYYAIISQKEITNGWERISVPFDTTKYAGTLKEVRVNLATANTTTVDATFTGILVTFGDYLENWNHAPEDLISQGTFTEKTTEIEKSVDGIKENITKVENTQTSFDKRVTNVEKTSDVINQSVSKLQETQTQQGKAISEAQATIKQHSDELALSVKMKDVEDYVGGIGSINLIRNAKLTNGVKYWKLHDATRTHIDTTVVKDGINSFKTVSTGNTSNHYYGAEQTVELREGETIVASAYFRTDNPAGLDQGAALEIKFLGSGGLIKLVSEELKLAKDQWLKVYKSAIAPSGTVKAIFRYQVRRNGTLWMAQPMLQVGTIPSSFL